MAKTSAPTYVEFDLEWLISLTGITQPSPFRRLNAFENVIAELVHQWRDPLRPLDPQREIRMSEPTRVAMMSWVEHSEIANGSTVGRLVVYGADAVCDASAHEGWVRLLLVADERTRPQP